MSKSAPFLGNQRTLIFDSLKTNSGAAYNKYTGAFSAPRAGLYFFSWTIVTGCHEYSPTQLVVNNAPVAFIEADGEDVCDYTMATGNAVLQLAVGDVVFVRSHPTYHHPGGLATVTEQVTSSFSGFLIYESWQLNWTWNQVVVLANESWSFQEINLFESLLL